MTILALIRPETTRIVLFVLAVLGYAGYHVLRWRKSLKAREKAKEDAAETMRAPERAEAKAEIEIRPAQVERPSERAAPNAAPRVAPSVAEAPQSEETHEPPSEEEAPLSGEEANDEGAALYAEARAIPHQAIPDFIGDTHYLELLALSAEKGFAPAMAKLGEYAMRRGTLVEAYFWMRLARHHGLHGLSPTIRDIRRNWARGGFRAELSNVNPHFNAEAGSLGRALLHADSGHEAAKARAFLGEHYPEFL